MRKVKALEIFAAAIAAVPVVAFADEYAVPTQGSAGQKQQVNIIDAVSGRFSLLPTSLANGGPEADVDAIWDNGGASTSWHDAPNWTTEPAIPDGPNAIARFTGASGGAVPTLGTNTVTLNKLFYNDGQLSGIIGGQLNFANTGEVNVTQSNSELTPRGSLVLADLGTGNNTIGGAGTFQTVIGGNVGLTKTGPGPLELGNANTFTGAVNINGGRLLTTAGDAAFGNSANQININNGATLFVTAADMDTSRTINIGAGGGSITYFDAGRQFISRGNITGSSTLTINGIFGTSAATFTTAKSFSGLVHLKDGSLTLADTGAIASASGIRNDGTLVVNGGANRIGDATPISMRGSVYRQNGGSETVGPVTLEGSTSWFAAENNGAINMASLNRGANRGDVSFRGLNLGTGGTTITFANGPALLKGGIIPFAYGNAGPTGNLVLQPETEQNTLVTYGANGVTPITNYHSDINTSTASDNVLIGDAGASLTGNRFANALVLRVSDFYLAPPMEVTGNGTVNLTTGVVLNAHAGFDANGNINSTPGNIIRPGVNINAGTNELIIMAPSALRIEGALHGSGGLTKNGGRTVNFAGNQSTYTGVTNLSGFIRFDDSVPSGAPSPFGSSTTAINMYAGNFNPQNVTGAAANGTMDAVLAIDDAGVGNIVFDRGINSHGPGTTFIRNFGNSTFTINGPITVNPGSLLNFHGFGGFPNEKFVVNGAISGSGDLYAQDRNGATVSQTYELILNGNNSGFTGDFYTGGNIVAGNDNALGSGLVVATFPTFLESRNGPRTFANDFSVLGGLGSAGNQPITLTGDIFGQVGAYTADVNGSATMTWAGTLSGGGFFKSGPGTLVISGNNTGFGGPINVGNGSIEGNFVILASNTAVGDVGGITAANFGNNTVLLAPGVNIASDETFLARGEGVGGQGSLRSTSGVTTWGGSYQVQLQLNADASAVLTQRGVIGVDSGTMNLNGTVFAPTFNAGSLGTVATGFAKVGNGTLNVGSAQFTSGTSTFQGSVVTGGSFEIAAGTVRMQPNAGGAAAKSVADVTSLNIAGSAGNRTARLDLTNNAMVIDYGSAGPSPITTVRADIQQGFANGSWSGNGITTSSGNASQFGLGYAEASNVLTFSGTPPTSTFFGDVVDQSALLIRHTRFGDANLDGQVNLADFNRLAANFGTGTLWQEGDFDYNGIVNLADFNRLAANFGQAAAGPSVTPEDWAALAAAVPEPTSLALVAVAGAGLLQRRRRNAR